MKVVFRVDASHAIASGHIMRCLALAQSLRKRGAACTFISREVDGHLFASVVGAGFEQRVLPGSPKHVPHHDGRDESSVALQDDANETIDTLENERINWLVVDHYALDAVWERYLRPHVDSILVIDDLADRQHDCDVLLDQNFSLLAEQRYVGLVSAETQLLCGPRYALLHPEFYRYRSTLERQHSTSLRAFISFGGSDPDNLTGLALEAFQSPDLAPVEIDVAIGRNNPHQNVLARQIASRPGTRAHLAPSSLAPLMAKANFAIGAGGTTTWERFCLDLPSVVIASADNQIPSCESLAAARRINYVGFWTDVTVSKLQTSILEVAANLEPWGLALPEPLVDGLGAERVAEVMVPSPVDSLVLRPATNQDVGSYFSWVNDPDVRNQSLRREPVSWLEHQVWFEQHLADPDSLMYVLETRDLPLGQVRFDCTENHALLDYSVDKMVRGRGLGATLIRRGLQQLEWRSPLTVNAKVRDENRASTVTLTRTGFQADASTARGGVTSYLHRLGSTLVDK